MVKNLPANAGDTSSIPDSERSIKKKKEKKKSSCPSSSVATVNTQHVEVGEDAKCVCSAETTGMKMEMGVGGWFNSG